MIWGKMSGDIKGKKDTELSLLKDTFIVPCICFIGGRE